MCACGMCVILSRVKQNNNIEGRIYKLFSKLRFNRFSVDMDFDMKCNSISFFKLYALNAPLFRYKVIEIFPTIIKITYKQHFSFLYRKILMTHFGVNVFENISCIHTKTT